MVEENSSVFFQGACLWPKARGYLCGQELRTAMSEYKVSEAANFFLTDSMRSSDSVLHIISTLVTYLLFDLNSSGRVRCISSIFHRLQILGSNNDKQVMPK